MNDVLSLMGLLTEGFDSYRAFTHLTRDVIFVKALDKKLKSYENNCHAILCYIQLNYSFILCDNPGCKDLYHVSAIGRSYSDERS